MRKKFSAVDLFCGAGGMSLGLQMAGFDIGLGLDFVQDCKDTHHQNFTNTTRSSIYSYYPHLSSCK